MNSKQRQGSLPMWLALLCVSWLFIATAVADSPQENTPPFRVAYLASDLRIPFWSIMAKGVRLEAEQQGAEIMILSADNSPRRELQNLVAVLNSGVDGIVISPTTSLACTTLVKLAQEAEVPVVVADIGCQGGDYLSYISSDNDQSSYYLGKVVAEKMRQHQWQDGRVGIVAIPQKRLNGQQRTTGFMRAMNEDGISAAGILQQVDFSYTETYHHSRELLENSKDLRAIWLQGSDRYQGALDAIRDSGREGEVLLATFDAEPEFMQMIPAQTIVAAAMQQPRLIGERAVQQLIKHRQGESVKREIKIPVLVIDDTNIAKKSALIKRNVLGL